MSLRRTSVFLFFLIIFLASSASAQDLQLQETSFDCKPKYEGEPGWYVNCIGTYIVRSTGRAIVESCIEFEGGTFSLFAQILPGLFVDLASDTGQCTAGNTWCEAQAVSNIRAENVGQPLELKFKLKIPGPTTGGENNPFLLAQNAKAITGGAGYGPYYRIIKRTVTACCAFDPKCQAIVGPNGYGWSTNYLTDFIIKKPTDTLPEPPTIYTPCVDSSGKGTKCMSGKQYKPGAESLWNTCETGKYLPSGTWLYDGNKCNSLITNGYTLKSWEKCKDGTCLEGTVFGGINPVSICGLIGKKAGTGATYSSKETCSNLKPCTSSETTKCSDGSTITTIECKDGFLYGTNNKCPGCGDGITGTGEECDDGNTASGDGCSSTCKKEEPVTDCGVKTFAGGCELQEKKLFGSSSVSGADSRCDTGWCYQELDSPKEGYCTLKDWTYTALVESSQQLKDAGYDVSTVSGRKIALCKNTPGNIVPPPVTCNNNGVCDSGETIENCPSDCKGGTGAECGTELDLCDNTNGEDSRVVDTSVCKTGWCYDPGSWKSKGFCTQPGWNQILAERLSKEISPSLVTPPLGTPELISKMCLKTPISCGDGTCVTGETASNCPKDCTGGCGDGVCDSNETQTSCPSDCEIVSREDILGDELLEICSAGDVGKCSCQLSRGGDYLNCNSNEVCKPLDEKRSKSAASVFHGSQGWIFKVAKFVPGVIYRGLGLDALAAVIKGNYFCYNKVTDKEALPCKKNVDCIDIEEADEKTGEIIKPYNKCDLDTRRCIPKGALGFLDDWAKAIEDAIGIGSPFGYILLGIGGLLSMMLLFKFMSPQPRRI